MTLKAPFPWFGVVECDHDGTVWRVRAHGRVVRRRIDRPDNQKGYRNVRLPIDGQWRTFKAHRIVWWYFNGPIPDEFQVNHKNMVRDDNRLGNLELATPSQNIAHSYANGRSRPWSSATRWRGRPRVSPEVKASALSMRAEGALFREIAAVHGLSVSHVHRITTERRYGNDAA